MGLTYATIELVNQFDEYDFKKGRSSLASIRRWSGQMMVDTGAIRLVINEEIRDQLGLERGSKMKASLADGNSLDLEVVGGIKVRFGDRYCYTGAFVLPGNTEPLLGVVPLEEMDLVIIPSRNTLEYNPEHPDGPIFSLK